MEYVLGMDCGTTNSKAVLVSGAGEKVAEAACPNRFIRPEPGRHEQDAETWWGDAVRLFHALSKQAGSEVMERIAGICVSSHTVSMLPVDDGGRPLRHAITYQDGRSHRELRRILDRIGRERYIEIVGGQPSTAFLPGKLLWFKEQEPELFSKTHKIMQASSYINLKLTGAYSSDIDQASRTQCMDVDRMEWSKEIGDCLGVDLQKLLPPLYPVDGVIGAVTGEAAKETGLRKGTPVLAGCSDAMASVYALGLGALGDAGESSGTTSLCFFGSRKRGTPEVPVVTRHCAIEGMPYIFDAPIQTSGAAVKWFIDRFAQKEQAEARKQDRDIYALLNESALEAAPGSGGLLFFPYLLGERAPLWKEHARGMFIGLGMDTERTDLIRSVFEGTAFALKHVYSVVREAGAEATSFRICGGGAKSRTWCQIKAAMLNLPVHVLSEGAGDVPVGDALLAGHRMGLFPDLKKAAERVVKIWETIEPDREWVKTYDALYPYYVEMYQRLDECLARYKDTVDALKDGN